MRKIILSLLIGTTIPLSAQTLDFSLSVGTGKTYLIEDWYNSVNVNYGLPLSLLTELKFTPNNSSWGLKLRLHHLESTVVGTNWVTGNPLDGYINSMTTSFLLENNIAKVNHSYGFNFGIGLTKETIQPQQIYPTDKEISTFPSFILGTHLTFKLNKNFDFQILPILLWQDPFKSIEYLTGKRNANFAGEDLSLSLNFGIRYTLFKQLN